MNVEGIYGGKIAGVTRGRWQLVIASMEIGLFGAISNKPSIPPSDRAPPFSDAWSYPRTKQGSSDIYSLEVVRPRWVSIVRVLGVLVI